MGDQPANVHRNVAKVIDAGRSLGVEVVPRTYPQGAKTAQDAADAIGVGVGQIVKSLIFGVETDPADRAVDHGETPGGEPATVELVLAYVSGSNQLDESKLAAAAGAARCRRVDADSVRSATGYPIGGVPPFGHDNELRVFIDPDLLGYDEVWAAAGTWHDVFGIDPAALVDASGGQVVDLKRV